MVIELSDCNWIMIYMREKKYEEFGLLCGFMRFLIEFVCHCWYFELVFLLLLSFPSNLDMTFFFACLKLLYV